MSEAIDERLKALLQPRSSDDLFEQRFLVRDVLEALLQEARRSAERSALTGGRPLLWSAGPATDAGYRVELDPTATSPDRLVGVLRLSTGVTGVTGGGTGLELLGPLGSDAGPVEMPLVLDVPWVRSADRSMGLRAVLSAVPGRPSTFRVDPSPPQLGQRLFGVPLDVLELDARAQTWRPLGWRLAGLEGPPDDAVNRVRAVASRIEDYGESAANPRMLGLATALARVALELDGPRLRLEILAHALEQLDRQLNEALSPFPPGIREGLLATDRGVQDIPYRERSALLELFWTPNLRLLLDQLELCERLAGLLDGTNWRIDESVWRSAEPGQRVPIWTKAGQLREFRVLEARAASMEAPAVFDDRALLPSTDPDDAMVLRFDTPGLERPGSVVTVEERVGDRPPSTVELAIEDAGIEAWHNHVWRVRAEHRVGTQTRLSARMADGRPLSFRAILASRASRKGD
ncbi:MAG TPA: hypothetical protein RMG48_12260 [Myxococcales bacterium LLY-WYZ-16_1]|nr:hypothetical protein [Myxococcales bacterium LLY-WYZ-16_1]